MVFEDRHSSTLEFEDKHSSTMVFEDRHSSTLEFEDRHSYIFQIWSSKTLFNSGVQRQTLFNYGVKVEMYKNGEKVAYLKFGGFPNYDNVSKSTWFKPEYLQDSSWKDLNKHINSSTLHGYADVGKNKFDVTTYNNCTQMWFMIVDFTDVGRVRNQNCFKIPNLNAPFFVYSTKGTHANTPGDVDFADVLVIYGDVET
ncbi:unnamed protein product [Mytilus coruscus]|uniref:Uncharacterized protein n=1 Tax=Mytilus coruscus TaxID=42192 RepID=A0A6J8B1J1_MYTCO|nr:unnamed protein product [Mytilus coruscus]